MNRYCLYLLAACLALTCGTASAQEIIHAVSGTVKAIYPKAYMLEINTDDGSSGHFQWEAKLTKKVDFNKNVSADATAIDAFSRKGAHVIVYYYGTGEIRNVVAVRDLGDAAVTTMQGSVVKLDKHDRVLTVKVADGTQELHLDPKTVVDTVTGVQDEFKYGLDKGVEVSVVTAQANGAPVALLINPAI
ncbi:MAG TPA: hypothetical protein VN612_06895 [Acidobacteriaceae bacterium]|nr:hypothetical protein [Acidobacteriaceae bacterium]